MNKEEIYIEATKTKHTYSDAALLAMDEYAKQEAIEFAEWASENYHHAGLSTWDGDNDETFTTTELYQLFLNNKTIGK